MLGDRVAPQRERVLAELHQPGHDPLREPVMQRVDDAAVAGRGPEHPAIAGGVGERPEPAHRQPGDHPALAGAAPSRTASRVSEASSGQRPEHDGGYQT
jgi:hypothetical protein